jgi:RHS repeat-associated protein
VSGTGTVFSKPSGASDYTPSSVSTPASASTTTIDYQVVSGVAQPTRLLDVVPDGVSSCSPMVKGCRALTFTYASSTTATGTAEADWGNYAGQISKISFTVWDPATSQMRTVDVASYLYDSNGRLRAEWDPRISPALRTRYGYDASGHVTELTPPGLNAWSITYATITGDANTGRVSTVSRPGDPSGTETTTITYQVPVSGSGAPYSMGPTSVAPWGQHDLPTDATAIFPPGHEPSGTPPSSYTWATVHYLDRNGMEVNTAASDGSGGAYVTTTEYERFGNVVRTLSAANRQRALADPSPAQTAGQLDEQSTYSADGIDLIDSYGPLHQIQLANGNVVSARRHTHYEYGQGALVHLPTTITEGAAEPGTTSDQDLRTTTTGYDSTLLQPTVTTTDAVSGGLNLTSTTAYDAVSGNVSKTIMPANPSGGDARETDYFYYRGGTGSGDSACNSTPEWSGLLCKTKPAVQPSSGNNLPVTTYTYDLFLNVATKTETVPSPSATRTTTFTHDAVGRLDTVAISGPGTSVPTVTYGYDSDTGLPTTTSTSGATITRAYDGLGRLSSYTDADSNVSSYAYDLQDRPTSLYDGKGTYALSYDQGGEHRGLLTTLQDSQAGSFGASYDADGALLAQSYPNGMTATYGYDESGAPTSLVYTKTTNCSSDCDWYADQVTSSIHGQWLSQDSSLSSQSYTYDQAGRLTGVDDTPVVEGSALSLCTRRAYAYDADSNRTSLTSWDPDASTGACNSTGSGTVRSWTYDQADRVTNSGYTFDAFGRITQVPAADGGGAQTSLSYHANDRVRTLAASGNTDTITIDAVNRVRTTMTSSATQEWHYAGEQDSPAWIAENNSGNWSRNVVGLNGMLAAIANQSGVVTLDLTNLHGDIVATASTSETATSPTSTHDQTEFGVPRALSADRYGWLGGYERPADPSTGSILMGARVYLATTGRFVQTDPIAGGGANAYEYAMQDPVNETDISGEVSGYTAAFCGNAGCIYYRTNFYDGYVGIGITCTRCGWGRTWSYQVFRNGQRIDAQFGKRTDMVHVSYPPKVLWTYSRVHVWAVVAFTCYWILVCHAYSVPNVYLVPYSYWGYREYQEHIRRV